MPMPLASIDAVASSAISSCFAASALSSTALTAFNAPLSPFNFSDKYHVGGLQQEQQCTRL